MKANTFAFRSSTDVKFPRFSTFRATMLNQISTWFIHEACFGVEWNTTRWLASLRNAARVFTLFRMPDLPFFPNSAVIPETSATYRTSDSEQCVLRLSATTCHGLAFGSLAPTPW